MVQIVSDTSTLYSSSQAQKPGANLHILPFSPAFITQGGPGCVAVQYIRSEV